MKWGGKESQTSNPEQKANHLIIIVQEEPQENPGRIRLSRTNLFVPPNCTKIETFSPETLSKTPLRLCGQLGEKGFEPLSKKQQKQIETKSQSLELPPINNVVSENVFCVIGDDGRIFFRCEQGIEKLDWLINNVLRITWGLPLKAKVFASFKD